MPTVQLQFFASDATVVLEGAIFDAATDAILKNDKNEDTLVVVRNTQSNAFKVPSPGNYWYEFAIRGGPAPTAPAPTKQFDVSLKTVPDGAPVDCLGNPFDPADGLEGRKSSFNL